MGACQNWAQFKVLLDRLHPVTNAIQMDIFFDLLMQSPEDFDRWQDITS
jgi:hypothetical protein